MAHKPENVDGSPDLLSDLPSDVMDKILGRLPLREAMRTCILSRGWIHRWCSIKHLRFDDDCVNLPNYGSYFRFELAGLVDRVLLLHRGPMARFEISSSCMLTSTVLNRWLLFLSRYDVKELSLSLGDRFHSPSGLFNWNALTDLNLTCCEINLPAGFTGFTSLKSLNLDDVDLSAVSLENLISTCPILETVKIRWFTHWTVIKVRSPVLKYLHLEGSFESLILEDARLLNELWLDIVFEDLDGYPYEWFVTLDILNDAPSLEKLTGLSCFADHMKITEPPEIPVSSGSLKCLNMAVNFEVAPQIISLLQLMNISPCLEEVEIMITDCEFYLDIPPVDKFFGSDALKACGGRCNFPKLKLVKMPVSGHRNQMELIKFLLNTSPVLQKMIITLIDDKDRKDRNVLLELVMFRRASPDAEILVL